jgi:hypothetical protein
MFLASVESLGSLTRPHRILGCGLGNGVLREAPGALISFSFINIDPLQPKLSAAWQLSRWTLTTLIEYSIAFTSIPLSQSA